MHQRLSVVVVVSLLLLAGAAPAAAATGTTHDQTTVTCGYPVSVTDATGQNVTLDEPPERVVTLSPSAAQTMWEIGAEGKVVGVTQYASYLDGASSRVNVSGAGDSYIDQERVISLEPDLVLAPDTISNETVDTLRAANLTVYHYPPADSVSTIEEQTLVTGQLVGECDGANETVAEMESELDTVRTAVDGQERPGVLYTFFGYTAGDDTFINKIIETAGGTNVAAEAGISGYAQINQETVVEQNPQWIMRNSQDPTVPKNAAYNSTDAVKNGNVIVLDYNYLNQPAPRVVQPITKLAKAMHPDAWEAANATTTTQASESTTTQANATTTPATETTSATSPGFGVAGALVGLLAALAVATRRFH
ncbi:PGF-CTERM-anchored ABC transporter substrate-binding protein [Halocalculus aciditolerans]|uniref:Cobalamin-binding protein n=1 Tax=Halocalculus aciditolerans TaxID=1383812 RepID=A0A830FDV7_9EURY|nr:PGF-CTERM-anchored ABC transporter substrate-binding protein [Halocalculus aciditolerans]GGL65672.1 cobalamin-binding protein [Halocalculus aciditolerans]